MKKLPVFSKGEPLADHVSSERMNTLVRGINANRPIAGRGLTSIETADGTILSITSYRGGPGVDMTPYVMGSTKYGSAESDLSDQKAPETDKTLPHLDTWDIDYPPYTYAVAASGREETVGVRFCPVRVHIAAGAGVSYVEYLFTREITADSKGNVTKISKETLQSKEYASGSGSSGGGV